MDGWVVVVGGIGLEDCYQLDYSELEGGRCREILYLTFVRRAAC